MNDIGFGILCFGDKGYFKGAKEKEKEIRKYGFTTTILTDNPNDFAGHYIYYNRGIKSYHDKIKLVQYILNLNEICILIDADTHINDYSFLHELKSFKFKKGISYLDTLYNHPEKKIYNWELNLTNPEWREYEKYASSLYPNFRNLTLMWEYFIIFNVEENLTGFYETYEKLQIVKEGCDIKAKKEVLGNGEGVSITLAAKLNNIPCEWDKKLYETISHNMSNMSKKWTV